MSAVSRPDDAIHRHAFVVSEEVIDRNGHVNNVVYVQWMQDVAVRHSDATGGTQAARDAGGTWVVRTHRIEYLRPALAGDQIEAQTWVSDFRRAASLRKYRFVRQPGGELLARGETDWVFIGLEDGRPRAIPNEVAARFPLRPPGEE
ncbi:MAG: thioesterase family protein [Planctomycetota bacterium]